MPSAKSRMLMEILRKDILGGKYCSEQPFPSRRALARRFGIPATTVQRALDGLAQQGLISRAQGAGSFVTRTGASRKIGLIVPGMVFSEFFSPVIRELVRVARQAEYELLFGEIGAKEPRQRLHEARELAATFIRHRVAGVVYQPLEQIAGARNENERILDVFRKADIPVVLLDSEIAFGPDRSPYDVVSIDNLSAGERIARHLIEGGAKNIHFMRSPAFWPNVMRRQKGVMCAVTEGGLPWSGAHVLVADPEDVDAVRRHMRRRPRPDAVVCESDTTAAKFVRTLGRIGFAVPNDVRIAGFDDVRIASLLSPPLTTVHQPCEEIARAVFDRLRMRISNRDLTPTEILLDAPLVVRESTRRPSGPVPVKDVKQKRRRT